VCLVLAGVRYQEKGLPLSLYGANRLGITRVERSLLSSDYGVVIHTIIYLEAENSLLSIHHKPVSILLDTKY
jgi:hypothetical protein